MVMGSVQCQMFAVAILGSSALIATNVHLTIE